MKAQLFKITMFLIAFAFAGNVFASKDEVVKYEEEALPVIALEIQEIETIPTVILINKYGEVVAQFYGKKGELKSKFVETFNKAKFILNHGNQHIYLVD